LRESAGDNPLGWGGGKVGFAIRRT